MAWWRTIRLFAAPIAEPIGVQVPVEGTGAQEAAGAIKLTRAIYPVRFSPRLGVAHTTGRGVKPFQ